MVLRRQRHRMTALALLMMLHRALPVVGGIAGLLLMMMARMLLRMHGEHHRAGIRCESTPAEPGENTEYHQPSEEQSHQMRGLLA